MRIFRNFTVLILSVSPKTTNLRHPHSSFSSLPSPQSSSKSHFQSFGIHRPLSHRNLSASHFLLPIRQKEQFKNSQTHFQSLGIHRPLSHRNLSASYFLLRIRQTEQLKNSLTHFQSFGIHRPLSHRNLSVSHFLLLTRQEKLKHIKLSVAFPETIGHYHNRICLHFLLPV